MKQPSPKVLWLALIVAQAACATEREPSRQNLASVTPTVVPVSSANYTFHAPDTVDAGWTTFRFQTTATISTMPTSSSWTLDEQLKSFLKSTRKPFARRRRAQNGSSGSVAPAARLQAAHPR